MPRCIDFSFSSTNLIPCTSENDNDTQISQDTLASRVRKNSTIRTYQVAAQRPLNNPPTVHLLSGEIITHS